MRVIPATRLPAEALETYTQKAKVLFRTLTGLRLFTVEPATPAIPVVAVVSAPLMPKGLASIKTFLAQRNSTPKPATGAMMTVVPT
jgi:hypothetical protein